MLNTGVNGEPEKAPASTCAKYSMDFAEKQTGFQNILENFGMPA